MLPCSVIKGDGCSARRGVQGFLRPGVQDVNICRMRPITLHSNSNKLINKVSVCRTFFSAAVQSFLRFELNIFLGLTLLVHKNRRCPKRCDCVHQEKAVMSAGDRTVSDFFLWFWLLFTAVLAGLGPTFCRCLQSHLLGDRDQQKTLHV